MQCFMPENNEIIWLRYSRNIKYEPNFTFTQLTLKFKRPQTLMNM